MSELISGEEAKLAWANGEDVEFYLKGRDKWFPIRGNTFVSVFDDAEQLRIKPQTITINGIEVPAPFKPKRGQKFYYLNDEYDGGYSQDEYENWSYIAVWRTESEIKQVVEALRSVFK